MTTPRVRNPLRACAGSGGSRTAQRRSAPNPQQERSWPTGGWERCVAGWWRAEEGRVTAFVVVLTTAILAVAGLTLDGGRALAAKVEAIGRAESAARAGADAIDLATYRATGRLVLVPDRAAAAARTYLATVGATGQVVADDGQVSVTVTATTPTQLLGLVGITDLTVHATGSAHPRHGVATPDP